VLSQGSDEGSLPFAMLLTLVAVMLTALLVPIVLGQIGSGRVADQRTQALHAAATGLEVVEGQLRAAVDNNGNGDHTMLPCGPVSNEWTASGTVNAASAARYEFTVDYLSEDPRGRDDAWVAANRITCAAGDGTSSTPMYGLLRSTGTQGSSTRRLRATYVFRTDSSTIPGGLIDISER
jgi:hypothetical protein